MATTAIRHAGLLRGVIVSLQTSAAQVWTTVQNELKERVAPISYSTWFSHLTLEELDSDQVELGVPSRFIKEWLRDHYLDTIREAFQQGYGLRPEIRFRVVSAPFQALRRHQQEADAAPQSTQTPCRVTAGDTPAGSGLRLRAAFRLETFVGQGANRLALTAAERVVTSPGEYSPLLFFAESGRGKTHLLQGICHGLRENVPEASVLYVTFESFTREFVQAVEQRKRDAFRRRYESCDLLAIDDLQLLAQGNREKTQSEFLHIFDHLTNTGSQVVISSQCHPEEIEKLDPRLARRLTAGLTLQLSSPSPDTQAAIVQTKAARRGIPLDADAARRIAELSGPCVRGLEGAVARLAAFVEFSPDTPVAEAVDALLASTTSAHDEPVRPPDIETIAEAVAKHLGIGIKEMCGRRRSAAVRRARNVAMLMVREIAGASYASIGEFFGGRSHATVISALKRIQPQVESDTAARDCAQAMRRRFGSPKQERLFD